MDKKKIKRIVHSLIFNIIETVLIVLIGMALSLPINSIISMMLIFVISRGLFGKAIHFKDWYRCLIWSLFILFSLFVILKANLFMSILFAIFSALIMTGKSNIYEIYLWNNHNEPSKYKDVIDFINNNESNDILIDFENKLEKMNDKEYLIYKYRFKEGNTFGEISDKLDIDGPRIVDKLDKIAFALRLYCNF